MILNRTCFAFLSLSYWISVRHKFLSLSPISSCFLKLISCYKSRWVLSWATKSERRNPAASFYLVFLNATTAPCQKKFMGNTGIVCDPYGVAHSTLWSLLRLSSLHSVKGQYLRWSTRLLQWATNSQPSSQWWFGWDYYRQTPLKDGALRYIPSFVERG
jgi:hypothetical protein